MVAKRRELTVAPLWAGGLAIIIALAAMPAQGQSGSPQAVGPGFDDTAKLFPLLCRSPDAAIVTNYHSWSNAVSLNNGVVEVIVVPSIGRVQQFRFVGDTNGVFWENAGLFGRSASGFYRNFGGDKAWPSPQADWNWPPPRGFDGSMYVASCTNGIVTMTGPVDQSYGIRVTRSIGLVSNLSVMLVKTVFERTSATARIDKELGAWIDCQATVTGESRCYSPVPASSIFPSGYTTNGSSIYTASLPASFANTNGLVSFGRDPRAYHKLGFDNGTLVLVGPRLSLRMDASRIGLANYPDGNCSTEVYTASGADAYFELEMMGPLTKLSVGSQLEFTTVYSIYRRTETTSDAEARKLLSF
ncbi:MAG TPA: hypothetical protein VKV04_15665 [Verrucomicrobiae bacterium]|nr:hypothetical protein [Verrucomicrobiae bacterium]